MGGLVQRFDRKSKRYVVLSDFEEGEGRKVTCLIEGSQASVKPDFTRSSKDAQAVRCSFPKSASAAEQQNLKQVRE